jgi:periplasmic divalent cation tolerance protein
MTDKVVVLVTTSGVKEARKIANTLVEERLAACVNVLPKVRSYYRWKGGVQSDEEYLLVIKSSRPRFVDLRKAIERLHSYKVPEIICLPIVEGADPYMNWLEESLIASVVRVPEAAKLATDLSTQRRRGAEKT